MLNTLVLAIITASHMAPATAVHGPRRTTCDVRSTLQRVEKAIGGDPTRHARSVISTGNTRADGLVSRTQETVDFAHGRFLRDDSGSSRSSRVVFDGRMLWQRDWTGGVHPLDGTDARMGALTDAYLRRYGYFHRGDAATFRCVAERGVAIARYDVVSIVPQGGREVRLWIDRRSGLVAKTVQQTATSTATITYSDYREVDGFALPFSIHSTYGTDTSAFLVQYATFKTAQPPRSAFARPATKNDGEMVGAAPSTTVPLLVEDGKALVEADVNGHRLLFQLDTGGHAILTREAARVLGLHATGAGASGGGGEATTAEQYAAPQTLRLGQARIHGLPFFVIAYGRDFWDRGPGRAPLAGILGLEIFERFAVRLNYRSHELTLTPLHRFTYRGPGTALPLTFEEDTPLVPALADDVPGLFQLDTGNSGGTILFGPFLRVQHFDRVYPVGFDTSGSGTGGEVHLRTRRLQRLRVDGLEFTHFITYFVNQRGGAFSSRTEAGNLGYDILSQFAITFDYLHLVAYVEPLAEPQLPVYNRIGIVATREKGRLVVDKVLPDSPASDAHIVRKDWLVRVDGRKSANMSTEAFRVLTRGTIGSRIDLELQQRGRKRHVVLRFRELLCNRGARCSPAVRHVVSLLGSARTS